MAKGLGFSGKQSTFYKHKRKLKMSIIHSFTEPPKFTPDVINKYFDEILKTEIIVYARGYALGINSYKL